MKKEVALFAFLLLIYSPSAAASPDAFFSKAVGDGFGVQIKASLASDKDLVRIKKAGFGFVRFAFSWMAIEKEKGVYDWRPTDDLVGRVRAVGIKMIVPLLSGNPIYDGWVPAPPRNADHVQKRPRAPSSPESIEAYARFAAAAALRYGGDDIAWEMGNEPDLRRFWPPTPDVQRYSVLAETTCKKIRNVMPQAVILGPSLGLIPNPYNGVTGGFLSAYLASGAAGCASAVSVHPYRHGTEKPEAAFEDYHSLFLFMAANGQDRPLVNSEWGYTGTQVSEELRASYVLRTRLTDVMWGVPLTIWYEWKDSRADAHDPEGRFGLMQADGTAKPALEAIEKTLPFLRHAVLERQIHLTDLRDILLLFDGQENQKILVGWTVRDDDAPWVFFVVDGKGGQVPLTPVPAILARGMQIENATLKNQ